MATTLALSTDISPSATRVRKPNRRPAPVPQSYRSIVHSWLLRLGATEAQVDALYECASPSMGEAWRASELQQTAQS